VTGFTRALIVFAFALPMSVWVRNTEKSVLRDEYRAGIKMFAFFPAATVEAYFAKLSKLMA
jgi:hypothetical protein